jgi:deoxyribodipyrimidine photolyase
MSYPGPIQWYHSQVDLNWTDRSQKAFISQVPEPDFDLVLKSAEVERSGWGVSPVDTFQPGTLAGLANLQEFVESRLKAYGSSRNDPNAGALSNLSPWVNTGQVRNASVYVPYVAFSSQYFLFSRQESSCTPRVYKILLIGYSDAVI